MKGSGLQRRDDGSGTMITLFEHRFPPILSEQYSRGHPCAIDMTGPAFMRGGQQLSQGFDPHGRHVTKDDQYSICLPCFGIPAGGTERLGHAQSGVDTDGVEVGWQEIGYSLGRDHRRQLIACRADRTSRSARLRGGRRSA